MKGFNISLCRLHFREVAKETLGQLTYDDDTTVFPNAFGALL